MSKARLALTGGGPLVVLTGAGMSAESGVPTFRDARTGLWERYDPTALATPEAWERDRDTVWAWYRWREHLVGAARPNAGHLAIARAAAGRPVVVVTQNVDDLHERAGSEQVHHLHGSLFDHRCDACGTPIEVEEPAAEPVSRLAPPECPRCPGRARPGVVWFGESLPVQPWESAVDAISAASAVLVVGTSGLVYPAASLPALAADCGTPVIEVNPGPSGLGSEVTLHLRATAAQALPALLAP
ncbi:NAD-dependent protein deacylase [Rhodococcus sp. IEGM 1408]|uniref:NAD-dependent protein deacylase n=1 Tax=Rhodococcus sp. IEGM 1408 TaxID=3082220 RepID=UPI002955A112|nr:NAD-dependent protein deacylase [Rhodococcus sp. IEGM 1408]MDV8000616.1 NAD-dependent protein deacylase [Rhodococcus sp. IEGM 1408]